MLQSDQLENNFMSERYNGWTNYPTWRVNLEVFDGGNWSGYSVEDLKQFVYDQIFDSTHEGIARDYALTFVSEVNWNEINNYLQQYNTERNNIDEVQ